MKLVTLKTTGRDLSADLEPLLEASGPLIEKYGLQAVLDIGGATRRAMVKPKPTARIVASSELPGESELLVTHAQLTLVCRGAS